MSILPSCAAVAAMAVAVASPAVAQSSQPVSYPSTDWSVLAKCGNNCQELNITRDGVVTVFDRKAKQIVAMAVPVMMQDGTPSRAIVTLATQPR